MAEKIKVAHVAYDLQIGGVASILDQLFRKPMTGYEQILILLCGKTDKQEDIPGVKTYRLDYEPSSKNSLPALFNEMISPRKYFDKITKDIDQVWQQERFGILHFHVLPRDLGIGSFFLNRQPAVKLVYTDHALRISKEEHARVQGKLLKRLYRELYKPYHTIFVSRKAYEWALETGMIRKSPQNTFIENSIDLAAFRKKTDYSIEDKVSVVYVSRITAVKGHFLLIPIAKALTEKFGISHFQFVLIGPGELTESLREAISKNGLDDHFVIEGPRSGIGALLASYDLGVFPSEREGLPVALLEKMACGLPVVASDIPEIRNVISNPDEAVLFPSKNAEACAEKISQLVKSRDLRERTGHAARKGVEERYSYSLAEKYSRFYDEVLKQQH